MLFTAAKEIQKWNVEKGLKNGKGGEWEREKWYTDGERKCLEEQRYL